ncbi:hypothetical protein CEXT_710671 [Caerostris extrusa]|uniref:Uncharacterized protein n=1 Tax=Caerostris extrusa TaxID=172846 RepID=A0AAV4PIK0_CAEEX|nr:hypothetical protein CEXT_710671 [Caerostris extrusa]
MDIPDQDKQQKVKKKRRFKEKELLGCKFQTTKRHGCAKITNRKEYHQNMIVIVHRHAIMMYDRHQIFRLSMKFLTNPYSSFLMDAVEQQVIFVESVTCEDYINMQDILSIL